MTAENHVVTVDPRGVATVVLNRPEVHNAFDDALIAALTASFKRLGADGRVRAVVVRGNGKSFSAGGDLHWMRRMATYSDEENVADGLRLAEMFQALNELPKPTVAVVHGNCFAGGTGLVASSDIAIAAEDATFAISEVRLGLAPATISPYVVAAMGMRNARRFFLTGERFDGRMAKAIGLVHETVPAAELDAALERFLAALLAGAPAAQGRTKQIIADVVDRPITEPLIALTARRIAEARASDEARDGLAAFFEKRKPKWRT